MDFVSMFRKVLEEMDRAEDLSWSYENGCWTGIPFGTQEMDTNLIRRGGVSLTSKGMKPVYMFRGAEDWEMLDAYRTSIYGKSCCPPGRVCASCCA